MSIISKGDALKKLIGDELGAFTDSFNILKPSVLKVTFDSFASHVGKLVIMESKKTKIMFKGQFELVHDKIIFISSIWVQDVDDIFSKGLVINDFAEFDPTIDMLHILKARQLVLDDFNALFQQVNLKNEVLKKSEERYRNIISNMNLGLAEVSNDGIVKYVNKSFCEMSQKSENDLVGKIAEDVIELMDSGKEIIQSKNELRRQGISDSYEIKVKLPNGEIRWWLISGAPLLNEKNELDGSLGIHLDITAQKLVQEKLTEAKNLAEKNAAMKDEFLSNMSHEIRTPLSGIYGMAQLLNMTELDGEQANYVNSICHAMENLQVIINDILDYSKINSGKLVLQNKKFSLQEELKNVIQLLQPKAYEKNIELHFEMDENLMNKYYESDAARINQVLYNIIGNAIKFTHEGNIWVKCDLVSSDGDSEKVFFSIKDTGVGIGEEFLPYIFDKFAQEEDNLARKSGGTGLGMSISKMLVELMKGTISVESEKSKGSEFKVILPLMVANRDIPKLHQHNVIADVKDLNILVVEDSSVNRMIVKFMLEKEGAHVTEVINGQDAYDMIQKNQFDVVISDIQMPIMDGIELISELKSKGMKNSFFIALTANAFLEERQKCLDAGFDEVIFKPFTMNDLQVAIGKM